MSLSLSRENLCDTRNLPWLPTQIYKWLTEMTDNTNTIRQIYINIYLKQGGPRIVLQLLQDAGKFRAGLQGGARVGWRL